MMITHAHLRAFGLCNRDARVFFQRHGLDWRAFRHGGLPEHVVAATGDAQALALIDWVKGQNG